VHWQNSCSVIFYFQLGVSYCGCVCTQAFENERGKENTVILILRIVLDFQFASKAMIAVLINNVCRHFLNIGLILVVCKAAAAQEYFECSSTSNQEHSSSQPPASLQQAFKGKQGSKGEKGANLLEGKLLSIQYY